ncbi:MAG: hypothetical protein ACO3JG_14385 [Luteolibacter sp.]
MRIAKVRTTNFRPTAGKPSPVGRRTAATTGGSMTGLDHLAAIQRREAAEHDRAVAGYLPETVAAAFEELRRRAAYDRKNPEHRWILARKAALGRLALRMTERGEA